MDTETISELSIEEELRRACKFIQSKKFDDWVNLMRVIKGRISSSNKDERDDLAFFFEEGVGAYLLSKKYRINYAMYCVSYSSSLQGRMRSSIECYICDGHGFHGAHGLILKCIACESSGELPVQEI